MLLAGRLLDDAVSTRVLEVLQPAPLEIAQEVVRELGQRDRAMALQGKMRIERAEYEAQLAQRCYEEVDLSNRLVAGTLEKRWNEALLQLEEVRGQLDEHQETEARAFTAEQRAKVLALARDLPRLWKAATTKAKDKKRMLRLLIKDITAERLEEPRRVVLHIRWQGGACEDLRIDVPLPRFERERYSEEMVERVRTLAKELPDAEIASRLNREGHRSARGGGSLSVSRIRTIRHSRGIRAAQERRPRELTVREAARRFGVRSDVVDDWIQRGLLESRRPNGGSRSWITIDPEKESEPVDRSADRRGSESDRPNAREVKPRRSSMNPPSPGSSIASCGMSSARASRAPLDERAPPAA